MIRADLHTHTYYSDGQQSPLDIAEAAKLNGVNLVAVTDHDNMNGCDEMRKVAKNFAIKVVDGIEISAYDGTKIHILGYNLDRNKAVFKQFTKRLYDGAQERAQDILIKLKKHGVNITMADILKERKSDKSPVHAMHIARAAARKGYGNSPNDFFMSYLAYGRCAFSDLCRPTPTEAVAFIKECGGLSSLAHPGRITMDKIPKEMLIDKLVDCGLDGIEAVYSGHTESDTAYYKEIAAAKKLLVTGGSDTHFTAGNRSVGTPKFYPSDELLAALKIN
jgi:hypothetical protein